MRSSTRPQTKAKVRTDEQDIILLIQFLAERKDKLALTEYKGKTRDELLRYVATFYDHFKEEEGVCAALEAAMHADDWNQMLVTKPVEVESYAPPPDN